MSIERLKYLSENRLLELRSSVEAHLSRYEKGDFIDLAKQNGWSVEGSLPVDLSTLQDLDPSIGAEAEVANSLLVWRALGNLTPALATEERIWVRLSHLECLEFCRKRWLRSPDTEAKVREISVHFFAPTLTGVRDDHGVSRLWWNAYVARLAMPSDMVAALKIILKKADFRSNLIERARTVSRPSLAAGIIRAMLSDPWITSSEVRFRIFMKEINRFGGGRLFEVMGADKVDEFIRACAVRAQATDSQMASEAA